MDSVLLLPPITFVVMLAFVGLQSLGFRGLALKPKDQDGSGKLKPYACGEPVENHRVQPDYAQFFPFAFFFTIVHVVALVVTTVPRGSGAAAGVAVAFLLSAAVAIYVLFRR